MQAVNGREHTQLQPPHLHFIIPITRLMTANIMTPCGVANVGRSCREIGLEIQGFPGHIGITGEAHRIPLAAGTGISREEHGTLSVPGNVQNMQMIQHPQGVKSLSGILILTGLIGLVNPPVICSLLPIHPPKIHTICLIGMMQYIKVMGHKFLGQHIERNPLAAFGIDTAFGSHFLIHILMSAHPGMGMQVQCCMEVLLLQEIQEALIVRKQLCIPAIPCPAVTEIPETGIGSILILQFLRDLSDMPIHIHNADRERHVFFPETLN